MKDPHHAITFSAKLEGMLGLVVSRRVNRSSMASRHASPHDVTVLRPDVDVFDDGEWFMYARLPCPGSIVRPSRRPYTVPSRARKLGSSLSSNSVGLVVAAGHNDPQSDLNGGLSEHIVVVWSPHAA